MSGVHVDVARLADEQAALRRVAELVARGAAPAVVLEMVTSEACALVGVGSTALLRFERDGSSQVVALHDAPPELAVGDREPATGEGIVQRVLRSGRAARVDSYAGIVSTEADRARRLGVAAAAGAPILVEGRLWGVIVAMALSHGLADGLEGRLTEFAELAAVAIAGAQSREDLQELVDEQSALRRVAELVARGTDQDELFEAVAVEASRLVDDEATTLLRADDDSTCTVVATHRGPAPVGTRVDIAPDDEGIVAEVLRTRRPARLDDHGTRPGPASTRDDYGVGSSVGVPIIVGGRIWGILGATTQGRRLPEAAERRFGQFAELAAAALANAQARRAVEELADEQTALRVVAELVARGGRPDEVLAAVAVQASRLVAGRAVTLTRFDGDRALVVVAVHGGPVPIGGRVTFEPDTLPDRVRKAGGTTRVDDYAQERDAVLAAGFGLRAAVAAPIVVDGGVWGMLTATSGTGPLPSGTEASLLRFAELVAAAIASIQTRTQLERLAEEQSTLRRVAELVARGAPLEEVLAAVVRKASVLLGDHAVTLLRYDPDEFGTVVAAHASPARVGLRIPSDGDTGAGRIRHTGRPHRVDSFEGTSLADTARTLGVRAAVTVPILVEGRVWGGLSTSTAGPPLPAGTVEQLAQFAELAGVAIANAENEAKLSASRARVISTADETRRRLQRDVHDGAQQRLVHTIIALKLARDAFVRGERPAELVHEALTHAERANAELRDLVRGILPAALTSGGLRVGLASLVADLALPVDVRVGVPRLPISTETTAYFIVAEALTNAVKRARATRAEVEIALDGDALVIVVRDDGDGGADPSLGSDLLGLSDRVEAGGGTLAVSSPPGGGTTVRAVLPRPRSGPAS